jgi:hypothetical protein
MGRGRRSRKARRIDRNHRSLNDGQNDTVTVTTELAPHAASDGHRTSDGAPANRMSEETYVRERTTLIEIEQKSADQHDKSILTLTAGALGLSITFLDKIAAKPLPDTLFLVGISWSLFIFGIVCIVASFLTSQSACRRQRELLDEEYSTGRVPDQINRPADMTRNLNSASYLLFVAGVVSLALFSWRNLSAERSQPQPHGAEVPMQPTDRKPHNSSESRHAAVQKLEERGAVPPKRPASPPTGASNADAQQNPKK